MKNIIKKLKVFDSYGTTANLTIENKDKYQTSAGGLLSLIVYTLFLFNICNSLTKYINGENVEITFAELPEAQLTLKGSDFIFSFSLEDNNFTTIKTNEFKKLFDMKLYYYSDYEINKTFNFKLCNFSDYPNVLVPLYYHQNLLCPDIPKNETLTLNPYGNYLWLVLTFSDSSIVDDYIKIIGDYKKSKQTSFVFLHNKILVNPGDYKSPLSDHLLDEYVVNSINIHKYLRFELGQISMKN